ncbi:MAG: ABC transporter ATP-binding protein [Eubacteriales bacterium]|nr:ABC transporter ATP-binding protein [Eubacteriales bacterium]
MKQDKSKRLRHPERLSSYWLSQFGLCVLITLTGILYNFGMLANPYFEGVLIDTIQVSSSDASRVLQVTLLFVITIFGTMVFRGLKRYFVRRFANNTKLTIRHILYNNILNTKAIDLEKENIGTLLTRCQSDCFQAVEGMRKLTTEIFDTLFLFFFYIVYLFLFDVKMTLFALIPVAIGILFAFLMRKRIYQASAEAKKINSTLSGETFSLFDHSLMFRLYSRDEDNLAHYDKTLKEYEKKNVRSSLLTTTTVPISNVIALIGLIPIIYLGTGYVIEGGNLFAPIPQLMKTTWTIGSFTTYITTFVLLASKASHTANLFSSVEKGLSSWKRIKPYIEPYKEYPHAIQREGGTLVLKDFGIKVSETDTLFAHVNLEAKKGEILALTGPIASGKSAFGKVFLQDLPYEGSVILFDKELKNYSISEIKGNITYMGHRSELLTTSIKENISYGEKKDVLPYLKAVSFTKDFESLPEKENTIVGNEGIRLSGGQQERIALARTFYHHKGMVILDDPFASVDIKTEHEIMKSLREEAKDCILLFISHRLSYFPYCDKVLVINPDKTISIGTHDSLLKENPTYQQLYSLQKKEVNR